MTHPRTAATAIAVVVLVAGCTSPAADDGNGSTSSNPPAAGAPGAQVTTGPTGGRTPGPGPGAAPGKAPTPASEVPAPTSARTGLPPPTTPAVVRLRLPLPANASARGKVVPGFPATIVPVPPRATIVNSSVTGQNTRLQVGLVAISASRPADVVAFYRASLAGAGFVEKPVPAADGTVATSFVRGGDGVVVSVRTAQGGGSQISVAGTLVAG